METNDLKVFFLWFHDEARSFNKKEMPLGHAKWDWWVFGVKSSTLGPRIPEEKPAGGALRICFWISLQDPNDDHVKYQETHYILSLKTCVYKQRIWNSRLYFMHLQSWWKRGTLCMFGLLLGVFLSFLIPTALGTQSATIHSCCLVNSYMSLPIFGLGHRGPGKVASYFTRALIC